MAIIPIMAIPIPSLHNNKDFLEKRSMLCPMNGVSKNMMRVATIEIYPNVVSPPLSLINSHGIVIITIPEPIADKLLAPRM